MKKMTTLLLCLAMLLTFAVPVYAADEGDGSTPPSESSTSETTHTHSWMLYEDTATCTTAGTIKKRCSGCTETLQEDSPAKGHNWSVATDTATCTTAGIITKSCSGCTEKPQELSPAKGHSWNEGTVTTPATCMQAGVKTFTCANCSETKTEEIPMLTTHSYGDWTQLEKIHTRACTVCHVEDSAEHTGTWSKGDGNNHTKNCTICGKQNITEAHIWKEETVKPTCKDEGSKKKVCTVCAKETTPEPIPKLTTHTYDSACDPKCNVCDKEREIEHTFTKTWSQDAKSHWHECTKCGEKKDEANHVAGPAASEKYAQVCLTCNYVITPKKEHVHSYGTEWTSDEVGHWHACATCDEEKEYASHRYDDDCDGECNVCGYLREDVHKYDEKAWKNTNFEHWNVCSVCGEESRHEKHVPGEKATEKTPQLCTICGFELEAALEHDHDFGNLWHQNELSHWQECGCGELSVPEDHVWNEGRKNRNDTITYTCQICGGEKTEQAPSSGFPWLLVFLILLAVLCLGGIVVLVVLLKRGTFDEEPETDDEDFFNEDYESDMEEMDDEEKMIDDFFASLDEELYQ